MSKIKLVEYDKKEKKNLFFPSNISKYLSLCQVTLNSSLLLFPAPERERS